MVWEFVSNWGPESLLTVFVVSILMGWMQPKYTVTRLLKAKDELLTETKANLEARIADLKEVHTSIATDLRRTSDLNQTALGVAVDNNRKLVDQQNELLDYVRVATPALVARTNVLEARHGHE